MLVKRKKRGFDYEKNIVRSQCCECGRYGLCNQKTSLYLECGKIFQEDVKQINKAINQKDHLDKKLQDYLKKQKK